MATQGQGSPEVARIYNRALALCRQIEATPQLFPALAGLCGYYVMCGGLQTARELGAQLLGLAERQQQPDLLLQAHQALGGVLLHGGEFPASYAHWRQAMAHFDPQRGPSLSTPGCDFRAVCASYMAWCLWLMGYPTQAQQQTRQALNLARTLAHPFTHIFTLNYAAWFAYFYQDTQSAREYAESSINLATELGVPDFLAAAKMAQGWSLANESRSEAGLEQLRQGRRSLSRHRSRAAHYVDFSPLCASMWSFGLRR